jgi:SAM-dependent methyltransferase
MTIATPTDHARTFRHASLSRTTGDVASAYDHVGDGYGRYADGDGLEDPSQAANRFAHADAIVWATICDTIDQLRAAGVSSLRVLDAGCGPGTWTKRIADRTHRLGLGVEAVGFDISGGQLEIARKNAEHLNASYASDTTKLEFLTHDLAEPLPWSDGHFHLVLCNYVVLNHLPKSALPCAIGELCRVATFRVIATVRALAGPATGCIVGIDQLRDYREDCGRGKLALVLKDGTEHLLTFNLYSAETLKALIAPHATVVDLRAIDLFLNRFAPDAKWTGNLVNCLPGRQEVVDKLKEIEEVLCRLPGWIDHGTHVLIVAQPKPGPTKRPIVDDAPTTLVTST